MDDTLLILVIIQRRLILLLDLRLLRVRAHWPLLLAVVGNLPRRIRRANVRVPNRLVQQLLLLQELHLQLNRLRHPHSRRVSDWLDLLRRLVGILVPGILLDLIRLVLIWLVYVLVRLVQLVYWLVLQVLLVEWLVYSTLARLGDCARLPDLHLLDGVSQHE